MMATIQDQDVNELLKSVPFTGTNQEDVNVADLLKNAQTPKPEPLSWGDVGVQAIRNTPRGLVNLGEGIAHAVTHPVETGMGLLDIGAGALKNLTPQHIADWIDTHDPNAAAGKRAVSTADALGAIYKQRYGSSEGFKQALANDPVEIVNDLLTFVSPTGALKKGATATGKLGADVLGLTTGVGKENVVNAFKSGYKGDKSFWQNLTGQAPMTEVLDTAKQNLDQLRATKNAEYRSGMVDIKNDKSVLDFKDIDKAVNEAEKFTTYKGQIKNQRGAEIHKEIKDAVDEWKSLNPAEYHTPEGLDALKQKINGVVENVPYDQKTARTVGNQVYNAVKETIKKQAPTYHEVMKDYAGASDQIKEIERALSLKDTASADTAMRKLQSLTRNNVNTNYGNRLSLAKQLEEQGGQPFINALSGQAMNSTIPRGLAGQGGAIGTIGSAFLSGNPMAIAALPFQSPKVVGAAGYGLGKTAKSIREIADEIGATPANTALMMNLMLNQKKTTQEPTDLGTINVRGQ